jgi:nicotinamidase/pyrazinamidase
VTVFGPHSALLVVDVQNDFVDPSGSLAVPGAVDIVPTIDADVAAARNARAAVVYTQDWHPEATPHFARDGGVWPVHCVQGTWGAAFHPDLVVDGPVVQKGGGGEDGYSGFSVRDPRTGATWPTTLEAILRSAGVERLVIVGVASDYCVVETVTDARALGFAVEVPTAAIRAVDLEPGDGDRAILRMRGAGADVA